LPPQPRSAAHLGPPIAGPVLHGPNGRHGAPKALKSSLVYAHDFGTHSPFCVDFRTASSRKGLQSLRPCADLWSTQRPHHALKLSSPRSFLGRAHSLYIKIAHDWCAIFFHVVIGPAKKPRETNPLSLPAKSAWPPDAPFSRASASGSNIPSASFTIFFPSRCRPPPPKNDRSSKPGRPAAAELGDTGPLALGRAIQGFFSRAARPPPAFSQGKLTPTFLKTKYGQSPNENAFPLFLPALGLIPPPHRPRARPWLATRTAPKCISAVSRSSRLSDGRLPPFLLLPAMKGSFPRSYSAQPSSPLIRGVSPAI